MTKELKNYYRQVSTWLPCSGRQKKRIMDNIAHTVEGYLAEHPEADFAALQAHFGTPQQIASTFVDEMDTDELLNALKLRKRMIQIACACVIAVVAIWAVAVFTLWITGMSEVMGHTVVYPPVIVN